MAKGLRSKSMRKNRTYLRETLVKPLMRERQEKLAELMQQKLEEKQSPSLLKLKQLLPTAPSEPVADNHIKDEDDDAVEMNEEGSSDEEIAESGKKDQKKVVTKQGSKSKVVKSSKRPPKEMVWFK
jgi:hypothetical protein